MTSLLLAALLLEGAAAGPEPKRPKLLVDVALAAGASAAIAMGKPDIRDAIFEDARFSNVFENFAHPVRQVRIGTERDSDPFWVNNVAHPGLFALEGFWLKHRGYSDRSAFLFTQVHSIVWEFVIEGSAFEPSGKDLIADAAGAALGIWVIWPLLRREPKEGATLSVAPSLGGGRMGFAVSGTF
jgi:hypothetical protein